MACCGCCISMVMKAGWWWRPNRAGRRAQLSVCADGLPAFDAAGAQHRTGRGGGMTLLVKAQRGDGDGTGEIVRVTPESAGWTYVGFAAHRLRDGQRIDFDSGAREFCI